MKGLNLLSVAILGSGGVLLYSAVKGVDPRDVVRSALSGESPGSLPQKYGTTTLTQADTSGLLGGTGPRRGVQPGSPGADHGNPTGPNPFHLGGDLTAGPDV